MRTALALVALLAGSASAYAATPEKWCSDGFGKPAVLTMTDALGYILKIGKKTEVFKESGPLGTGLPGRVVGTGEVVYTAELVNAVDPNNPETVQLFIFRDRVFWPCAQ